MSKNQSPRIKITLTESERIIIKKRMQQYGYKTIASYIRDAAIYENIIIEKVEGKQEVMKEVDVCVQLCKTIINQQQCYTFNSNYSKSEINTVKQQNEEILLQLNEIKKVILNKLQISYTRKNIRDKIMQQTLKLLESEDN